MKKRMNKTLAIVLLTLMVVTAMLFVPACGGRNSEEEDDPGPKFIAHRGYGGGNYVDNTEEAFRAAAEMNFYGIETDIRKTKDGYFVCNHDASVEYADGTEKKIASTDRAALVSSPIKNEVSTGDAYLCTFETYLRACKEGKKVAIIELKDYFNKNEIVQILNIIDAEYDRKHVCFISFIYAPLLLLQKEDPSIELQYLSQTEGDSRFESCLKDGLSISVRYTILTEELAQTFHDAGLKVGVWTVNDGAILQKAYQMGVDYITTDVFDGDAA